MKAIKRAALAFSLSLAFVPSAFPCACLQSGFTGTTPPSLVYSGNFLVFLRPHGFVTDEYQSTTFKTLMGQHRKTELSQDAWFYDLRKRTLQKRQIKNGPPGIRTIVKIGSNIYIGGYGGLAIVSSAAFDDLKPIKFFNDHIIKKIVDGGDSVWIGTDKGLYKVNGAEVEAAYLGKDTSVTSRFLPSRIKTKYVLSSSHVIGVNLINGKLFVSTLNKTPSTGCGGRCGDIYKSAGLDIINLNDNTSVSASPPKDTVPVEVLSSTSSNVVRVVVEDIGGSRRITPLNLTTISFIESETLPWGENSLQGFLPRWLSEHSNVPSASQDLKDFLQEISVKDSVAWGLWLSKDTLTLFGPDKNPDYAEKMYSQGDTFARQHLLSQLIMQKSPLASKLLKTAVDQGDYFEQTGDTLARFLAWRGDPESIELLKRIVKDASHLKPKPSKNIPIPCPSAQAASQLLMKKITGAEEFILDVAYESTTHPEVRKALIQTMPFGYKTPAKVVAKGLLTGDSDTRNTFLQLYPTCSEPNPEFQPGVIAAMKDPSPEVRGRAARCVGSIFNRADSTKVIPTLLMMLRDSDAETRAGAIGGLGGFLYYDSIDAVLPTLEDTNPQVRREAAKFLNNHRSRKAVTPLIKALNDSDPEVRGWSAQALALIGAPEALEPLNTLLSDKNDWTRNMAKNAIDYMRLAAKRK